MLAEKHIRGKAGFASLIVKLLNNAMYSTNGKEGMR